MATPTKADLVAEITRLNDVVGLLDGTLNVARETIDTLEQENADLLDKLADALAVTAAQRDEIILGHKTIADALARIEMLENPHLLPMTKDPIVHHEQTGTGVWVVNDGVGSADR